MDWREIAVAIAVVMITVLALNFLNGLLGRPADRLRDWLFRQ